MIRKLLFGIIFAVGVFALSTGAYAEGGGTGDGILYVPSEYSTIAGALANADTGDTIDIASGTYNEGDLVANKQLTIQGAGSASTIIDASGAITDYGILLSAGGTSATQRMIIKGLTIKNSRSHGIKAYKGGGLNLNHVTLDDVVLTLNGSRGMEIHNSVKVSDLEIANCEFVSNVAQGLRTASNVIVEGMIITDSKFDQNSYGIYLQGTINNLTILGSTFNDSVGGYGGYMTETGPLTNLLIENSEFNNNVVGLMVWNVKDNSEISITGSSFQGNDKWGVLIWGNSLTDILIQDCLVLNNDGLGLGYYGIDFNTYAEVMTNVAVHYTNITGHTVGGGVKNRNVVSTAIVDATCNWWGSADGPSGEGTGSGDAVTEYVTFTPWLIAAAPDGPCIGGTIRGTKTVVASALSALLPTGDKKDDKSIKKAIDHIQKSLEPDHWIDDSTLDTKKGKKVFEEEEKAVHELMKIDNTDVSEFINSIVDADQKLAQGSIDEAIAGGGDQKEIDKANKEMTKAQDKIDGGDHDKAIEHYKKAWDHAQKALKKVS